MPLGSRKCHDIGSLTWVECAQGVLVKHVQRHLLDESLVTLTFAFYHNIHSVVKPGLLIYLCFHIVLLTH